MIIPGYRDVYDALQSRQSEKLHLEIDTDGDCRPVIGVYMEVGVDGMSPFEVASGCPVVEIGREYPELHMRGGIDKRIFARGPEGIRKEIAARLMAVNIVRMIILQAAAEHDVDPLRISFAHATRAILIFAPALATGPIWKLSLITNAMLTEIAAHLVPERHGRNEPRATRRERKHYPTLHTTRQAWRLTNAA